MVKKKYTYESFTCITFPIFVQNHYIGEFHFNLKQIGLLYCKFCIYKVGELK